MPQLPSPFALFSLTIAKYTAPSKQREMSTARANNQPCHRDLQSSCEPLARSLHTPTLVFCLFSAQNPGTPPGQRPWTRWWYPPHKFGIVVGAHKVPVHHFYNTRTTAERTFATGVALSGYIFQDAETHQHAFDVFAPWKSVLSRRPFHSSCRAVTHRLALGPPGFNVSLHS